MTERRFNEAEVAAIFERATTAQQNTPVPLASSEGMSLADIQAIGKEVGIAPELLADAAKAVARGGKESARRFLGFPIGVARTVELDRNLTENEWERLVADLRETFDARGKVRSEGGLKQWTNGNLQALLEPTTAGQRLRLRTLKGSSLAAINMGIGMVAIAGITFFVTAIRGAPDAGLYSSLVTLAAMGAAAVGFGALQVPRWARERRRQMQEIAERLTRTTALPSGDQE
jgi:hypothetical protein